MPGLITPYLDELSEVSPKPSKPRKIAAFITVVLVLLAAAPIASAGVGNDVPNPGWEVD